MSDTKELTFEARIHRGTLRTLVRLLLDGGQANETYALEKEFESGMMRPERRPLVTALLDRAAIVISDQTQAIDRYRRLHVEDRAESVALRAELTAAQEMIRRLTKELQEYAEEAIALSANVCDLAETAPPSSGKSAVTEATHEVRQMLRGREIDRSRRFLANHETPNENAPKTTKKKAE